MTLAAEGQRAPDLTFVRIHLPGQPRGKGRPRFGRRGDFVAVWTDKKTEGYEFLLKEAARRAMQQQPMREGPVSVVIHAAMEVPASWSKKKHQAALSGDLAHIGKPDFDNIAKIAGDSLNKIVWKDDSQIVACTFVKFYAAAPGLTITVADWAD